MAEDSRTDPPLLGEEREMLASWLELYRATVPLKLDGLTDEQLCLRPIPPSSLSLLGLVRHLTEVERYWFTEVLTGVEQPGLYSDDANRDGDFDDTDPSGAQADIARYQEEVQNARARALAVDDLSAPLAGLRHGKKVNLRWVYVHMIEEYARHLGHADLIREAIDGVTGY